MPTNLKRIIPLMFLTHDRLSSTCLHWHKMHLSRVNSVTVVRCVVFTFAQSETPLIQFRIPSCTCCVRSQMPAKMIFDSF